MKNLFKKAGVLLLTLLLSAGVCAPAFAAEPAKKYAVWVRLNYMDADGALLPVVYDFTPADFSADRVRRVYVDHLLHDNLLSVADRDMLAMTALPDPEEHLLRKKLYSGIPVELVLQLNDESEASAAAFAGALDHYETDAGFTDEQKAFFAQRLAEAGVVSYDTDTIEETLARPLFLIWAYPYYAETLIAELKTLAGDLSEVRVYSENERYVLFSFAAADVSDAVQKEISDKLTLTNTAGDRFLTGFHRDRELNAELTKLLGDPDGDGQLTAADARLILRAAVGLARQAKEIADLDGDGAVSAADARLSLRRAVGLA